MVIVGLLAYTDAGIGTLKGVAAKSCVLKRLVGSLEEKMMLRVYSLVI